MNSDERTVASGRRVCAMDTRAWRALCSYLEGFPATEKFGIGIGFRQENRNVVLAFVWPKQEARSSVYCQIRIEDLSTILPFIVDLRERTRLETPIGVSAWVHTHPNLGIFLSGTDRATFRNWADVDPDMLAVVVDVFERNGSRFKGFAPDFTETPVELCESVGESFRPFLDALVEELPTIMRDKGRPLDALITPWNAWNHRFESEPTSGTDAMGSNDPSNDRARP